ncbi:MAG: Asp-tRNA(Asn)/Glu-tRNA(Gln) amidotransferase subunit GatC [candidate division WOR-3 bacterium]
MNLEKEVERILELARLQKKEKYIEHFIKILEFFKKIDELDLKEEKPFFYLEHLQTDLREDKVSDFKDRELLFKNSPLKKGNFFVTESPIE